MSAVSGIPVAEAIVDASEALPVSAPVAVASAMFELGSLAADPLTGLSSAGIGWLIEHVAFLREPLDALAGDPDGISQLTEQLNSAKNDLGEAKNVVASLDSQPWAGQAADGYRAAASASASTLDALETAATATAGLVTCTGIAVAELRGWVRDTIAEFVAKAIIKWAAATATAVPSMGATMEAFIAEQVGMAAYTGSRIMNRMSTDLAAIAKPIGDAQRLSVEMSKIPAAAKILSGAKVATNSIDALTAPEQPAGVR